MICICYYPPACIILCCMFWKRFRNDLWAQSFWTVTIGDRHRLFRWSEVIKIFPQSIPQPEHRLTDRQMKKPSLGFRTGLENWINDWTFTEALGNLPPNMVSGQHTCSLPTNSGINMLLTAQVLRNCPTTLSQGKPNWNPRHLCSSVATPDNFWAYSRLANHQQPLSHYQNPQYSRLTKTHNNRFW